MEREHQQLFCQQVPTGQVPQFAVPPHPSDRLPHWFERQAWGVQHAPEVALHFCPFGQPPQSTFPPHPSSCSPQNPDPTAHVFFVHPSAEDVAASWVEAESDPMPPSESAQPSQGPKASPDSEHV